MEMGMEDVLEELQERLFAILWLNNALIQEQSVQKGQMVVLG